MSHSNQRKHHGGARSQAASPHSSPSPNAGHTPNTRLIYGFHALTARLRLHGEGVREIFVDQNRLGKSNDPRVRALLAQAAQHGVGVNAVEGKTLDSWLPQARHQGVAARVDARQKAIFLDDVLDTLDDQPPLLLVLDGVTDPRNLGACLRVADAAGAHAVIAPKDRAAGLTDVALKAACGAAESVPYIVVTNLARTLREIQERDICVIGTAGEAENSLYQDDWPSATAWVMGAEGEGMRQLTRKTCDRLVHIPMGGMVDSLNVSVAAGVCLFEARRRLLA